MIIVNTVGVLVGNSTCARAFDGVHRPLASGRLRVRIGLSSCVGLGALDGGAKRTALCQSIVNPFMRGPRRTGGSRRTHGTTIPIEDGQRTGNSLSRDFTAEAPNEAWMTRLTF